MQLQRQRRRLEHLGDVGLAEDLLEGVEGQARELGLDEVGAVLHHNLQLPVPLLALPARHEVQQVHALVRAAVLFARFARELDGAADEEGAVGGGVDHLRASQFAVELAWQERK